MGMKSLELLSYPDNEEPFVYFRTVEDAVSYFLNYSLISKNMRKILPSEKRDPMGFWIMDLDLKLQRVVFIKNYQELHFIFHPVRGILRCLKEEEVSPGQTIQRILFEKGYSGDDIVTSKKHLPVPKEDYPEGAPFIWDEVLGLSYSSLPFYEGGGDLDIEIGVVRG